MTQREACRNCPFRNEAVLGYDADALFALGGSDPNCHMIVGAQRVFATTPTPTTECIGHQRWAACDPNYREPFLASE